MNTFTPFPSQNSSVLPQTVFYQRSELNIILSLYGRMVAAGEWRDYGISSLRDVAIFSVFRRTAEQPLYRIEKHSNFAISGRICGHWNGWTDLETWSV